MTLLSDLQSLLGDSYVLTGADAESYVLDWRRRYRGAALAVIRPGLVYLQSLTGITAEWGPAVQGLLILAAVLWDSAARREAGRAEG